MLMKSTDLYYVHACTEVSHVIVLSVQKKLSLSRRDYHSDSLADPGGGPRGPGPPPYPPKFEAPDIQIKWL